MIGTQRSGSNLLRLMLSQLPGVFAPHPPHIMLNFYPLMDRYGDLERDENFSQLIDDVCHVVELNPVPWEGAVLDRARIWDMCRRRSLLEVFIRIHELQCIVHGLNTWCCKSLETVAHIDHYAAEGVYPYIIYLYRDGRDVALSFRKAIVGEKHFYHLARKWRQDQQQALDFLETISADRLVTLSYKDLIAEPTAYIHHICDKFSLPYSDSILDYYKSEESKRTAVSGHMWENVAKPIMKDNSGKFLKEMSHEDLVIYESVAGDMLERLGFELTTRPEERRVFSEKELAIFDAENTQLKEDAILTADPHDLALRKPQADFMKKLRDRPAR
ncbi:MAG: sulfotransferase [Bacteroidetes bacterium]|nr:sulfotransferase [Bacteroidota bacterium]